MSSRSRSRRTRHLIFDPGLEWGLEHRVRNINAAFPSASTRRCCNEPHSFFVPQAIGLERAPAHHVVRSLLTLPICRAALCARQDRRMLRSLPESMRNKRALKEGLPTAPFPNASQLPNGSPREMLGVVRRNFVVSRLFERLFMMETDLTVLSP